MVNSVGTLMKNLVAFTDSMNENARNSVTKALLGFSQSSASQVVGQTLLKLAGILPSIERMLSTAVTATTTPTSKCSATPVSEQTPPPLTPEQKIHVDASSTIVSAAFRPPSAALYETCYEEHLASSAKTQIRPLDGPQNTNASPAPHALPPQTLSFDSESAGHSPTVTHVVLQSNQQDSPPGLEQQLVKDLVQCVRRYVFRRSMHQWRQHVRACAERLTRLVQLYYKQYLHYLFKRLFNKTVGAYKIRNCIIRRLRSIMTLLQRATRRHFFAHFREVVAFESALSHKRKLWARRYQPTLLRNAYG